MTQTDRFDVLQCRSTWIERMVQRFVGFYFVKSQKCCNSFKSQGKHDFPTIYMFLRNNAGWNCFARIQRILFINCLYLISVWYYIIIAQFITTNNQTIITFCTKYFNWLYSITNNDLDQHSQLLSIAELKLLLYYLFRAITIISICWLICIIKHKISPNSINNYKQ